MPDIDLDSELLDYIVQSGCRPGDRLPTINELQEKHLGLSISKVREQLEVARALGFVEVRSKTGMKMKEYSFTPAVRLSLLYALSLDLHHFELFTALRNHVEVAFWNEACETLTSEDLETMRECVAAARAKLGGEYVRIPNEEHRKFHMTMFAHLENPFVTGILEAYWDAYNAVEITRYADYSYHQQVWDFHEQILNAIAQKDFERAKALFVQHTQLIRFSHNGREKQSGA